MSKKIAITAQSKNGLASLMDPRFGRAKVFLLADAVSGEVFDELVARGYRVSPQVRAGGFRIDLVVEGIDDRRLAIECDGDRYHGPERWLDDLRRQRVLERTYGEIQ